MRTHEEIEAKIEELKLREKTNADKTDRKDFKLVHHYTASLLEVLKQWLLEDEENAPNVPM